MIIVATFTYQRFETFLKFPQPRGFSTFLMTIVGFLLHRGQSEKWISPIMYQLRILIYQHIEDEYGHPEIKNTTFWTAPSC